jgi:hypothetical protein
VRGVICATRKPTVSTKLPAGRRGEGSVPGRRATPPARLSRRSLHSNVGSFACAEELDAFGTTPGPLLHHRTPGQRRAGAPPGRRAALPARRSRPSPHSVTGVSPFARAEGLDAFRHHSPSPVSRRPQGSRARVSPPGRRATPPGDLRPSLHSLTWGSFARAEGLVGSEHHYRSPATRPHPRAVARG